MTDLNEALRKRQQEAWARAQGLAAQMKGDNANRRASVPGGLAGAGPGLAEQAFAQNQDRSGPMSPPRDPIYSYPQDVGFQRYAGYEPPSLQNQPAQPPGLLEGLHLRLAKVIDLLRRTDRCLLQIDDRLNGPSSADDGPSPPQPPPPLKPAGSDILLLADEALERALLLTQRADELARKL